MKLKITKYLLIALASLVMAGSAEAQGKFGTINLQKVFDGYWRTRQADSQLKERGADFQKQSKEMLDAYQKANEEYKKLIDSIGDKAISAEEQEKRKKAGEAKLREIQEIETQIKQFENTARETLGLQTRRMRESVLKSIQDAVTEKARKGGFALVVDTAAQSRNETPIVMFSSGDNDITDEILKQLNLEAPAEWLKPADDKNAPAETAPKASTPPASTAKPDKKDTKK
jgi:outer membrane protein